MEMHNAGGDRLRVAVVSAVRLVREGLSALLSARPELVVVGSAGAAAGDDFEAVLDARPEIILVEAPLVPAVAEACAERSPAPRLVAFGISQTNKDEARACARLGVSGFLARNASLAELLAALGPLLSGQTHCSEDIADLLSHPSSPRSVHEPEAALVAGLTARENDVLELIASGLSNKEIAQRLGIGSATVKNHVHNLLEKLQVRRRGQAAAFRPLRRPPP